MESTDEMQLEKAKSVVPLNTWILISNLKLAYNITRRPDGSFNRHLAEFLDRKVGANISPVDGVSTMDVNIDRVTGVWARIFIPVNFQSEESREDKIPVFVYFHGGSFVHSSANSAIYDAVCRSFAKLCRAMVISVNFRRSPEYRYPVAYEDGFTVLKWIQLQALTALGNAWLPSNADLSHCFLVGDSSGANIVHHLGVMASTADLYPVCICGHILLMPMFGGMKRTPVEIRLDGQYFVTIKDRDYYWQSFLPEGADRDHPACNIFGPYSEDLTTVPLAPSLVLIASLDLLQDWQKEYVQGMRDSGKKVELVVLEHATVGFFLFPNTEHFHRVIDAISSFVKRSI
ncbi:hypothetical protein O6H91_04G087400 [Diphasiastrum complanatum]|uniref:Uncharacterized protein n=1 Tax=Diphasiastrum complanatum TaxID=34168 RepID=A0ACC2DZA3_DIPCM|nr:hypothetical protein O6H91_04G087400 [Diphasiastrum complanatum]